MTSTYLVIGGSLEAASTVRWYISGDAQSCTVTVSVAEEVSLAGGVTLPGVKLQSIPGGELMVSATAELKLLIDFTYTVTLPELAGSIEINSGDEERMKSGSLPVVTVSSQKAVLEAEFALMPKLPPGISAGTVTGAFQVPSAEI